MRAETWPHESGVRDVLHSSSDKNRELVLTVLVFHVRYSETVMPDARVDGEWQETPEPAVRWSNLTGGNQPEAVCESTFRRACTALLTFPAYFRQNASTAFIRRRFSVVT